MPDPIAEFFGVGVSVGVVFSLGPEFDFFWGATDAKDLVFAEMLDEELDRGN